MKGTRYITRTGLLLALAVLFQTLFRAILPEPTVNVFIVGTLVNAVLLTATASVDIPGGVVVGILTPVIVLLQGHVALIWMVPIIAAGNCILVIIYGLLAGKNRYLAFITGSVIKFVFLYFGIRLSFRLIMGIPVPFPASFLYSWPQLVTAVLGGIVAMGVIRAAGKFLIVNKKEV
ncbi:MAG TPA: ECF transporter S component [Clostridiales bacterium]|jgi:hypothetical protein|nr:ECF transporter S component [Clostridiales bacterium]